MTLQGQPHVCTTPAGTVCGAGPFNFMTTQTKQPKQRTTLSVLRPDMIRAMKLAIASKQADEADKTIWGVMLTELEKDCAAIYMMD